MIQTHLILRSNDAYHGIFIWFHCCSVSRLFFDCSSFLIGEIMFACFNFSFEHLYMFSKSCVSLCQYSMCFYCLNWLLHLWILATSKSVGIIHLLKYTICLEAIEMTFSLNGSSLMCVTCSWVFHAWFSISSSSYHFQLSRTLCVPGANCVELIWFHDFTTCTISLFNLLWAIDVIEFRFDFCLC